jgi:hypothetical protein
VRDPASPYVGPRPFEIADQRLFFGRDREAEDILSQIMYQRTVLLYAQSGAGKSSLINTCLVPGLREAGFFVFPVIRVRGALDQPVDTATNIYLFNALSGILAAGGERFPAIEPTVTLVDFISASRERWNGQQGPILIFDQFEELFTAHQDHWTQREGLFREIASALKAIPTLRAVFSMREDFIASLDPLLWQLTEGVDVRYRLELLRRDAAISAIIEPARLAGATVMVAAAEKLVSDLLEINVEAQNAEIRRVRGEYVEPVQLQIVCRRLWERLPAEIEIIGEDHVEQFGDVGDALREFYSDAVRQAAEATQFPVKLIHLGCTQFVTSSGTRNLVHREGARVGMLPSAVADFLVDQHLLRSEARAASRWYEITHDRLIEPILDKKLNDEALKTLLQTRELLSAAVAQWKARRDFITDRHILTVLSELKRELVLSAEELEFLGMNSIGAGFEVEEWIGLVGDQSPALIADMLDRASNHSAAMVRRNATIALSCISSEAADAALLRLAIEDDDPEVREQAAINAARADRPELNRRAFSLLANGSQRSRALVALAKMRDESVNHRRAEDFERHWRSVSLGDRLALELTLARVRLEKGWPNFVYVSVLGGLGAGLFCGLARMAPTMFGLTITEAPIFKPDTIFMGFFQGNAGGIAWGGAVGAFLSLGWILFRGGGIRRLNQRNVANVLFGIVGGIVGGIGVFMEIFFVFDPFVLVGTGWLPQGMQTRDLAACIGTGNCLFHPLLGPAFGAGIGLALSAIQGSGRLPGLLAPHLAAGRIVHWRRTACEIVRLSTRYSVGSLLLLSATAAVFVVESNFEIPRVVGETASIYVGNVGAISGILLGQLIIRVGIVIPPRPA